MFIMIETVINKDSSYYELAGRFEKLEDAQRFMRELSDDALNNDEYNFDTREVDFAERSCSVFKEHDDELRCVRCVIFDTCKDGAQGFTFD